MPTGRTRTSSATEKGKVPPPGAGQDQPATPVGDGSPGCPVCGGLGWLRRDVPVGHPDFGKAFACSCHAGEIAARRLALLRRSSDMAGLDRMTFESFQADAPGNTPEGRRSLAAARDAAREFAAAPSGWLVLHGGFGCGKTHLAAAVVNEVARRGGAGVVVVVPDLLDHLRGGYGAGEPDEYEERFEAVRDAPLLVLDDLGAQSPTQWASEKLFQLLNHRYNAELPTVITTNQELESLDDRLRSRLGHFGLVRIVEIEAIDYRGGVAGNRDDLSTLELYGDLTFASWDPRSGELDATLSANLARAVSTAREFAAAPAGWLVLTGDHGCGKTHLAAAIANQFSASVHTGSVVFVTVPDLLDYLRATFSPSTRVRYDQRFEEVRDAELLVLDDLGLESATDWAREKLFQVLGRRYAARAATVITMSSSLQAVHPWLRTRLLDQRRCTVFEIHAPAYGFRAAPGPQRRSTKPRR
jgi:DNA replication protein DnaC